MRIAGLRSATGAAQRAFPTCYGTARMRQKLLVMGLGVLVKTCAPMESAWLVTCGI